MRPRLVGIAGSSGAGKSAICEEIGKGIKDVQVVHPDNYWKRPEGFPRIHGYRNWELPECLDFDTLYRNL